MPHLETVILGLAALDFPYVTNRMLNTLADTAVISARLNVGPTEWTIPSEVLILQIYRSLHIFMAMYSHYRGIKESSASPKSDRRSLHSLRMDLYDYRRYRDPEANIVAALKRLRADGYEIKILEIGVGYHEVRRDLLHGESI